MPHTMSRTETDSCMFFNSLSSKVTHMGKKDCLMQGLFGLLFIAQVKYAPAYICQQATK